MFDIFKKKEPISEEQKTVQDNQGLPNNTYIDIVISLTKNYEIDLTVWIDDKLENKPMSQVDYALLCSEFLNNINSDKTKSQIIDILSNQIKNSNNSRFINSIITLMLYADKNKEGGDNSFIRPSNVFAKYNQ